MREHVLSSSPICYNGAGLTGSVETLRAPQGGEPDTRGGEAYDLMSESRLSGPAGGVAPRSTRVSFLVPLLLWRRSPEDLCAACRFWSLFRLEVGLIMDKLLTSRHGPWVAGGILGLLAVLLVKLGNPGNAGFCVAYFRSEEHTSELQSR